MKHTQNSKTFLWCIAILDSFNEPQPQIHWYTLFQFKKFIKFELIVSLNMTFPLLRSIKLIETLL